MFFPLGKFFPPVPRWLSGISLLLDSLDISVSSVHTRRRIWQESITTLLLTSPECRIPKQQRMIYAQAKDSEYPPYLLHFLGTPGERHVENLKVRDIFI
jgi:hypothetical protein